MSQFFTKDHELFRQQVRNFVQNEMSPYVDQWEEEGLFPRELFRRMGELGFLGIRYAEEHGGSGADYWYTVAFAEELARSGSAGTNMGIMVQTDMATPVIGDLGTKEQIAEFLTPAIKGEKIAALGVSEPGAGSDVAGIRTTARRVGDEFVINGAKTYITNGTRADFITLLVKTNPEAGHAGISIVLFPTDTKGFSIGKKLKKIGNLASDTAELHFDDCRVPVRNLLGEEGHGFYYLMQNFQGERLIASIAAVSGAQHAWERTLKYMNERHAFGKPISKFQIWRHEWVDWLTQIEAGRRLSYHAADLYNRKESCVREISMAKLFCGELLNKVVDRSLQAHGGMGYMEETWVARAWRDARLITIGGGTSEVMKEIISKIEGI
jgi:citronellyl-CoA dehydrogenase